MSVKSKLQAVIRSVETLLAATTVNVSSAIVSNLTTTLAMVNKIHQLKPIFHCVQTLMSVSLPMVVAIRTAITQSGPTIVPATSGIY